MPDRTRLALALLAATCLAQAVFAAWPEIDLRVSALFFDGDRGFWMRDIPALEAVRTALRAAAWVLGIPALMLGLASWHRRTSRLGLLPYAYFCTGLVLGPALVVDAGLKNLWGRARPAEIAEFGGTAHFTPAFRVSDQCARNCSFTSGEAAALTTLALLIGVLFWRRATAAGHFAMVLGLGGMALGGSALRIMTGRHFLSDVVFSMLICALVLLVLHALMRMERFSGATPADVRADIAATLSRRPPR